MYRSLASLVSGATELLALEVEELARVLLVHLNSYDTHESISQHNFFNALNPSAYNSKPEYGDKQHEVNRALMEAWAWLQSEAFLVRDPAPGPDRFFISRRGKRLKSCDEFGSYLKARLLPRGQLRPLIAGAVYPAFLRGEYDTAVFQAFREVEVAVRTAGSFPDDLVGVSLMREAFKPVKKNNPPGPLTDTSLTVAEQEGMAYLFAGGILLYKNPQSHRNVPTERIDAAEVIGFASHLLRIVDRLKQQSSRGAKP